MHDSKSPLQIVASSQLFMCFVPQFSCVLSARVDQICGPDLTDTSEDGKG